MAGFLKFNKKQEILLWVCVSGLVAFAIYENQTIQLDNPVFFPKDLTDDEVKKYSNTDQKAIVIYPRFTQSAYTNDGFYPAKPGEKYPFHTSVSLKPLGVNASYVTGLNTFQVLQQLHYPFISDLDVDRNPEILKDYDKIILLHNEYVTQKEFDAITSHPNVIYLYPNALYARIIVDYGKWTITLDKGHNYPDPKISNGFGYVTSSKNEYNLNCKDWRWEEMPNGIGLNCWPEFLIKEDRVLLQAIKDYPEKQPKLIPLSIQGINITGIPHCDAYGHCGKS